MIEEAEDFDFKPKKKESFNPIDEPKVERSYTAGSSNESFVSEGQDIPEPTEIGDASDFDSYEEIGKTEHEQPKKHDFSGFKRYSNTSGEDSGVYIKDSETKGEPKELNPEEQRRAIKKTAKILADTYANIAPRLFAEYSKFNVTKLNKLAREGEIDPDLNMGGTNLSSFIKSQNRMIDGAFTVPDEEYNEIKNATEDVLREKNVAMSPTTRLMFAVGQSLGRMMITAVSIKKNNNEFIEQAIYLSKMQSTGQYSNPAPFSDDGLGSNTPDPSDDYSVSQSSSGGSGTVEDAKYEETKINKPPAAPVVDDYSGELNSVEDYLKMSSVGDDPSVEQID